MPTLTALPVHDADNTPGFKKLWASPTANITSFGAVSSGEISAVTMSASNVFVELPVDPEGGAFFTSEQPEAEGTTGDNYSFQYFSPGYKAAFIVAAETFNGVHCTLIGEMHDGTKKILGDETRGMILRRNFESSNQAGNRQGLLMQGKLLMNHLPYGFTGTVPT